jgi:hypothetical protein
MSSLSSRPKEIKSWVSTCAADLCLSASLPHFVFGVSHLVCSSRGFGQSRSNTAGCSLSEVGMSSEMEAMDKAKEAAAEAKERKHLAPVSLTIAIVAVFVAVVSLLGHRAHTEEILQQTRATDQWAYYQAKNMRRNNLEALDEVLTTMENTKADRAQEVQKHFHEEIEKYREEQKDIETEARELEADVKRSSSHADRFDLGEVFLEIALVVTSITLLTDNRKFWYLGIGLASVGIVAAASGFLVH